MLPQRGDTVYYWGGGTRPIRQGVESLGVVDTSFPVGFRYMEFWLEEWMVVAPPPGDRTLMECVVSVVCEEGIWCRYPRLATVSGRVSFLMGGGGCGIASVQM
jgi:hypothetical protein